jgi:hypothetical protein
LQILSIYTRIIILRKYFYKEVCMSLMQKWLCGRSEKPCRLHSQQSGPGNIIETQIHSRIRIDRTKLDHFIAFANRQYFYQDVAYGTRKLKLDSGQALIFPNIIRNVTRSTRIQQYFKHCEEEEVEPLSRATLFRVLEVREASGEDRYCNGGSRCNKSWVENTLRKLNNAILYLRTDYSVHCKEQSPCPDHCRSFALSDSKLTCFQKSCNHEHNLFCDRCEELKFVLSDIDNIIRTHSSTMCSNKQKGDYMHDFGNCK